MGRKKEVDEAIERAIREGRSIYPPLTDKHATVRFIGFPEHHYKYTLQTRYEYWTSEGKKFVDWFKIEASDDEAVLNEAMKQHKKLSAYPKMKLKEEYRIIETEKIS